MQRVDGRGITTNYLYNDAEGKLTDIQYPAYTSLNVHLTYDGLGRRATMTDSTGSQSYAYDDLDALSSNTTTYTGLPAKTISYSFYNDGSRSAMSTPAGGFSYGYDAIGRMTNLTNPYSEVSNWTYLDNEWLWTQTLGNGAKSTYAYNSKGLTTDLTNAKSNGTLLSQFTSMVYDGAGNLTSMTAGIPAWPAFSGTNSYSYDSKDQLLQEVSTRAGGYTNNFAYDAAGNPTTFKGLGQSFNSNNQNTAYTFDNNGDPTTYKGVSLTFDVENRLTSYGTALTAGYRGDWHRAWKQTSSGRTYFVYDNEIPIIELDSSGSVTAVNTYGDAGLVGRRTGGGSAFYQFDAQDSVAQRLDGAQNVLSSLMFDAYGVGSTSGAADPFGYDAQWAYYTDLETGLHSLSYRYYDSSAGRFLNRDPVQYSGGINLYSHVANEPVTRIDPRGLARLIRVGPWYRPYHYYIDYPGGSIGFWPGYNKGLLPDCGDYHSPDPYGNQRRSDITVIDSSDDPNVDFRCQVLGAVIQCSGGELPGFPYWYPLPFNNCWGGACIIWGIVDPPKPPPPHIWTPGPTPGGGRLAPAQ